MGQLMRTLFARVGELCLKHSIHQDLQRYWFKLNSRWLGNAAIVYRYSQKMKLGMVAAQRLAAVGHCVSGGRSAGVAAD